MLQNSKTVELAILATCDLPQPAHRISTAEIGESDKSYLTPVDIEKVREQMKDLLNRIIIHFELHGDDNDDLW